MLARIFATLAVLVYAAVVPALELNDTHVFNPDWVAHARLHEVWQLFTNSMIGVACLWSIWVRQELRWPCLLTLLVTGGFFLAHLLEGQYGGSMVHSNGAENTLSGINIGVLGFGLANALSIASVLLTPRAR